MGTLTGQQINNTYDGLLKLSNSTTGITTSLQAIEDGLGNNTGARIGTNQFTAPNVLSFYHNRLVPDALGSGVGTGAYNPGTAQTFSLFQYFFDTGIHSYSSITYNVNTQTTTSDTVEVLFYDLQFVSQYGLFPCNLIMSGITLSTSPTGMKTTTLPSTLSFSGSGGGFYACMLKIRNAGVTPTIRYTAPLFTTNNQSFAFTMGVVRNNGGTGYNVATRVGTVATSTSYYLTGDPLPTYTAADIASLFTMSTAASGLGFNLDCIK